MFLLYRRWTAADHDLGEAHGVETRAADQRAVDIGLSAQLGDVLRLYAPTVDDPAGGGRVAELRRELLPDVSVRLIRLVRSGVAPQQLSPFGVSDDHQRDTGSLQHPLGRD